MGKILYTYGGFTAAQLKSRASIPSQSDIIVGANYIDCSSIDIPSEIRDAIGEGSNDLGTIYTSAKVNQWSEFSPRQWSISAGQLQNGIKTLPYDMSNFCGYNHNAVAPSLGLKTTSSTVYAFPTSFAVSVFVYSGEINWQLVSNQITRLSLTVYNGGSPLATGSIPINTLMDGYQHQILINVPYAFDHDMTLTAKLYFAKETDELVAWFPVTNTWNITVKSYYLTPVTWSFTMGSNWPETCPFNQNAGNTYLYRDTTDYALSYEFLRINYGLPFASNIIGNLKVRHYGADGNLKGNYTIANGITTSGSAVQNSLHFYKSGNLHAEVAGFPSYLDWGDNLGFYLDRVSGGF